MTTSLRSDSAGSAVKGQPEFSLNNLAVENRAYATCEYK